MLIFHYPLNGMFCATWLGIVYYFMVKKGNRILFLTRFLPFLSKSRSIRWGFIFVRLVFLCRIRVSLSYSFLIDFFLQHFKNIVSNQLTYNLWKNDSSNHTSYFLSTMPTPKHKKTQKKSPLHRRRLVQ